MSKFSCVCGFVINLSKGTSVCEFSLISEGKIDEVGASLSVGSISEEEFYDAINAESQTVYRCPKCCRLHVDEGGGVFQSYIKECD